MSVEELARMSPKAREKYLEILREMPDGRKFEIAAGLCDAVWELVLGAIRSEHPDATEDDIRREFARRVLPRDLLRRAYGW